MSTDDFDFQRYVARKKGARAAQVREGAAYAFPGDVKLLRTLDKLRPIQLAVEEAGRLWRGVARAELLGASVRAGGERFAKVQKAAALCAQRLHIDVPTVYVAPQPSTLGAVCLGTAEDVYIVISAALIEALTPDELLDTVGRECGRIQNGHVPFNTALHYLHVRASGFVRWVVRPATLTLSVWARRAQVTADRAGLLCTRDLDLSLVSMRKAAGTLDPAGMAELGRRERALSRFAGSAYYRTIAGLEGGEPADECDTAVARILDDKDKDRDKDKDVPASGDAAPDDQANGQAKGRP
jgi:Zn-dependent protease with chaperone function